MATRLMVVSFGTNGRQIADHVGYGAAPSTLRMRKWLASSKRWTQPVVVPRAAVIKWRASNGDLPRGFPGRVSDYRWAGHTSPTGSAS